MLSKYKRKFMFGIDVPPATQTDWIQAHGGPVCRRDDITIAASFFLTKACITKDSYGEFNDLMKEKLGSNCIYSNSFINFFQIEADLYEVKVGYVNRGQQEDFYFTLDEATLQKMALKYRERTSVYSPAMRSTP